MLRARLSSALVGLALSLGAAEACAETGEPVSVRVEGSIPCSSEADFLARVRRRASGARRGQPDEPTRTFTIRLDGAPPSMLGRLAIVHLDGRSSTREVSGESCEDVVDALALITAVDIDPDAARSAPSTPTGVPSNRPPTDPPPIDARPTAASPIADQESTTPLPVNPGPPRAWYLAIGIEPSVTGRVAPQPLFGLPLFIELTSSPAGLFSPSFAAGFERTFNSTTETRVGDAVFDLLEGFLQACPLAFSSARLWVGPCLRFDAGALQAAGKKGKSVTTARPESGPWLALGLAGRASYRLGGPVLLNGQFGLAFPLVPYEYRFSPDTDPSTLVGQTMGYGWRAGLGLSVRIL